MTTSEPSDLDSQVTEFTGEVARLLDRVFPDVPQVVAERRAGRHWISLEPKLPLRIRSTQMATLDVGMRCCPDTTGRWLALEKSWVKLTAEVDKTPILRFEYERDAKKIPSAHLQVHGHRGALSHLLSQAGHQAPHSMEALHLPVGGPRFRPALEDILEFLVADCGFDHEAGWRAAVLEGRERWRRKQIRSVVRDAPEDAADALEKEFGYTVIRPRAGAAPDNIGRLRAW